MMIWLEIASVVVGILYALSGMWDAHVHRQMARDRMQEKLEELERRLAAMEEGSMLHCRCGSCDGQNRSLTAMGVSLLALGCIVGLVLWGMW